MDGRPDGDVERALATFGGVSLRYFSFGSTPVRAPGYAAEAAADEYADRQDEPDVHAAVAPDPYIPGPEERVSEVYPLIGEAVPEARDVNVEPQWSLIDSAYGTEYSARSEADVPPELASGPALAPTHPGFSHQADVSHAAYAEPSAPASYEPPSADVVAAPPADEPPPGRYAEPEPLPPVEPVRSAAFSPPRSFGVRSAPSTMAPTTMASWPQRTPSEEPAVEREISPHAHEDFPTPEFTARHPSNAEHAAGPPSAPAPVETPVETHAVETHAVETPSFETPSVETHPIETHPAELHPVAEHEADALPHGEMAVGHDVRPVEPSPALESPLDLPEQAPVAEHHEAALQPARLTETVTVAHDEPAIDDLTPLASYATPVGATPLEETPVAENAVVDPSHGEMPPAGGETPAVQAPPAETSVPPPRGRQASTPPPRQPAALGGLFRARKDVARPVAPPPSGGSDALQDVFRRL